MCSETTTIANIVFHEDDEGANCSDRRRFMGTYGAEVALIGAGIQHRVRYMMWPC